VKEREGDHLAAISLYLKGGLPARAAQVRLAVVEFLFVVPLLLMLLSSAVCRSTNRHTSKAALTAVYDHHVNPGTLHVLHARLASVNPIHMCVGAFACAGDHQPWRLIRPCPAGLHSCLTDQGRNAGALRGPLPAP
jgi:hypothetical protein